MRGEGTGQYEHARRVEGGCDHLASVRGGLRGGDVTTLLVCEKGGGGDVTTLLVCEEGGGGDVTTLLACEEGGWGGGEVVV